MLLLLGSIPARKFQVRKMEKETDQAILFLLLIGILVFEALKTLLSILEKGILKDRRECLMKKTNKELRLMLQGFNKISKLKKQELVDMVIAYQF